MLERYYDDPERDTGVLTGQFPDEDGDWWLVITHLDGSNSHFSRECWEGEGVPVMGLNVEILINDDGWVVRELKEVNGNR